MKTRKVPQTQNPNELKRQKEIEREKQNRLRKGNVAKLSTIFNLESQQTVVDNKVNEKNTEKENDSEIISSTKDDKKEIEKKFNDSNKENKIKKQSISNSRNTEELKEETMEFLKRQLKFEFKIDTENLNDEVPNKKKDELKKLEEANNVEYKVCESELLGQKFVQQIHNAKSIDILHDKVDAKDECIKLEIDPNVITEIVLDIMKENNIDLKISKQALASMQIPLERHVIFMFEIINENLKTGGKRQTVIPADLHNFDTISKKFEKYVQVNDTINHFKRNKNLN